MIVDLAALLAPRAVLPGVLGLEVALRCSLAWRRSSLMSLVQGDEKSGAQLLFKALIVWNSNVITYGLWYWEFDRGGPVRRLEPDPPPPDFQFPQMDNPRLAQPGWQAEVLDYIYVSYTNSIAFSPTDVLPLTRWAKLLMLSESAVSALTVLLVAARAVNIFR